MVLCTASDTRDKPMKHIQPKRERRPPLSPKIRFGVGVTKPDTVWNEEDHIPPKTDEANQ